MATMMMPSGVQTTMQAPNYDYHVHQQRGRQGGMSESRGGLVGSPVGVMGPELQRGR